MLVHADPAWLASLGRGTRLALWYFGLLIAFIVIGFIVGAGVVAAGQSQSGYEWGKLPQAIVQGLGLIINLVWLRAIYLLTRPEPCASPVEKSASARQLAWRAALAAFLISLPGQAIAYAFTGTVAHAASASITFVSQVAGLISTIALLLVLRRLAFRIPNWRLGQTTRTVAWGLGITTALVIVLTLALTLYSGAASTSATQPSHIQVSYTAIVGCPACASLVGLCVFAVWFVILITQYHRAFQIALHPPTPGSAPAPGSSPTGDAPQDPNSHLI